MQIVKRHIKSCVWLDTLITVSAYKRLTIIHKTHNMSYNTENAVLYDLFYIILERWLQFRKISLIVKINFSAGEFNLKISFSSCCTPFKQNYCLIYAEQNTFKSYINQNQIKHTGIITSRNFQQPWIFIQDFIGDTLGDYNAQDEFLPFSELKGN